MLLEEGVCYDQCISWQNYESFPRFILHFKAKFACYSGCFLTSYFLSHARGATQDGQVMVERSDRMWSTGEGNGKPLQYFCLENPMNSMKKQNDRILCCVLCLVALVMTNIQVYAPTSNAEEAEVERFYEDL